MSIEDLREKFGSDRSLESLENLVKYLMKRGFDPSGITYDFLKQIYGCSGGGLWKICKRGGGLTNIIKKYLDSYNPRISFDEALERLCVGNRMSKIDEVYSVMLERNEGFVKELAKELGICRESVRRNARMLSDMGIVVLMNYFEDKNSKLWFRVISRALRPEDLKMTKRIRNRENLELLLLLETFGKIKKRELAELYGESVTDLHGKLKRILEHKWIVAEGSYWKLNEDVRDSMKRIKVYLKSIDENGFVEWYLDRWEKLIGRVVIKEELAEKVKRRAKEKGMSLRQLSKEVCIPYSSLKAYLRGRSIPPQRLALFVRKGYITPEEVYEGVEKPSTLAYRIKMLKKYGLNFILEPVKRVPPHLRKKILNHIISKSLRDLQKLLNRYDMQLEGVCEEEMLSRAYEMLMKTPTYRLLEEGGGKSTMVELVRKQGRKRRARDVLVEIEMLKNAGLIDVRGWRVEKKDLQTFYKEWIDYLKIVYSTS